MLLALFTLVGTAGFVWRALRGAEREQLTRHQAVASRLFDTLEDDLSTLVDAEEQRSFLAYRTMRSGAPSELAVGSDNPAIVGYFQLDPSGEVTNPAAPVGDERADAVAAGWEPAPAAEALHERLLSAVEELRGSLQGPAPAPVAAALEPEPKATPKPSLVAPARDLYSATLDSLNRGAEKRRDRSLKKLKTPSTEVTSFKQVAVPRATVAPPPDPVDVVVTPMKGRVWPAHVVLFRRVRIGPDLYHQGLVLDRAALQAQLVEAVLDKGIDQWVDLSWTEPSAASSRQYRFAHAFAEPFAGMAVWADLDPIPGTASAEAFAIRVLAGMLIGGLLVGGWVLSRAVKAELDYARRRTDFVAAVSHELKTPLTSLRMYAEMLRDGMVPADRQRTYAATMTVEAERLSRLIGNVLELSRLERGAARADPVVGEVGPVVQSVADMLEPHARQAGVELQVDVAPALAPAVIDRDALIQILVNLVDNAVKFGGAGQVVTLSVRAGDDRVAVIVRDRGPGVPPAQLSRIFEPFFRGERELTRTTQGTGIGLSLVDRLVRAMGGRVSARNHPEGGLEVTVALARA